MAGGSIHNTLSFHNILLKLYPSGFEEGVIATILREILKSLDYVHESGLIHTDIRAKNEPMKAISNGAKGNIPSFENVKFSKSFTEMVRVCMVVDPKKRPNAQKLLKHPFFKKNSKTAQYIVERVLDQMRPIEERMKIMREEACRRLGEAMDSQLQKRASFSDCVRRLNDISML